MRMPFNQRYRKKGRSLKVEIMFAIHVTDKEHTRRICEELPKVDQKMPAIQ